MTQIENGFYELIAMAKELAKQGICSVSCIEKMSFSVRYLIEWDIQNGNDFVKASALVKLIDEWAEWGEKDREEITYSIEDDCTGTIYMIDVSCVWL